MSESALQETEAAPSEPGLGIELKQKLPEILLEAGSVVIAVLLALAVDEWREERDNSRAANQARGAVLAEIRANHDELLSSANENRRVLDALGKHIDSGTHTATSARSGQAVRAAEASLTGDALRIGEEDPDAEMQVEYSVSLLTSAAWSTTQMTLATHYMEFDWVTRISKLYELQALFLARQEDLVSFMAGLGTDNTSTEDLLSLHHRLRTVVGLEQGLLRQYVVMHPELETDGTVDAMDTNPSPP